MNKNAQHRHLVPRRVHYHDILIIIKSRPVLASFSRDPSLLVRHPSDRGPVEETGSTFVDNLHASILILIVVVLLHRPTIDDQRMLC